MSHTHQTPFGRPNKAVQRPDDISGLTDKWDILAALTDAAEAYGLNHRTLTVLKALMSFLPGRLIAPAPLSAIVFPSNRTLSHRLNNMPDSTLRRHLATLVAAGIVSRHDSANRKRFARRVGPSRELAFGLDLSPLARQSATITRHAQTARRQHERLAALRTQVAQIRQTILSTNGPSPLTDDTARFLRRKPDESILLTALSQLREYQASLDTDVLSDTHAQNERHIQNEYIPNSDSEESSVHALTAHTTKQSIETLESKKQDPLSLNEVTETCQEYRTFFPGSVRDWHDLAQIADRLTPMIGIDSLVFKDAMKRMGMASAVTVVLCILERLSEITNPGGYLRRLTQKAGAGGFDALPLLRAIAQKRKLSADNPVMQVKTGAYDMVSV